MVLAYKLFVFLYRTVALITSPFNEKAKKAIVQRKESLRNLQKELAGIEESVVWFHAASLGEFEQGLPIMQAYKSLYPERKILVTFFSPSGYEHRKDHPIADYTSYLPWDRASQSKQFLDLINPLEVFFIKYEYWYFILREVHQRRIPLYSISARFVEDQIFFKWYGGLHRKMLGYFNHIFVQDQSSQKLLTTEGFKNSSKSGDTRFDNVLEKAQDVPKMDKIKSFKGENQLLILGSAWIEDIEILTPFLDDLPDNLKVLIAPHDISDENIQKMRKSINHSAALFSDASESDSSVLILNTIGHLFNVYQYGDFAYIGGAFGEGLHNILEATAFGLPVVFGNTGLEKFPEALELIELGGAFKVSNSTEAQQSLNQLSIDRNFRSSKSDICKGFMQQKKGATNVIMNYLRTNNAG